MWMVNFDGGWQPADNDAIVTQWVRQGLIGPRTLIRHSSWANPMPLIEVPAFSHLFGATSPVIGTPSPMLAAPAHQKAPGTDPKLKALLWVFGMLVVFGFLRALAASSLLVGIFAIIFGLGTIGIIISAKKLTKPPPILTRIAGRLTRHPLLLGGWLIAIIFGGFLGLMLRHSRITACEQAVSYFASLKGKEELPYDQVMTTLAGWKTKAADGRTVCNLAGMTKEAAGLEAVDAAIDRQEAAAREVARKEEEKKQREAAVATAAAREKRAVDTFPARSDEIEIMLKNAATAANRAKWEDSASILDTAQKALDEFAGTSVSKTKPWTDLAAKLSAQRSRIQPQIDRIKEQQRVAQAKLEADATLRGPKPLQSAWDGEVTAVRHHLKDALKDPDSYKFDKCTEVRAEGSFWVVECSYRANNSFGALVLEAKRFYIQAGGIAGEGHVVRTADYE